MRPMSESSAAPADRIAFQGVLGAYSHQACLTFAPGLEPTPCDTFADAFAAVESGACGQAMIPVHNTLAGPVPDAVALLAESALIVAAEHELTIRLALMAAPEATWGDIRRVASHPMALKQCAAFLARNGWASEPAFDTAGAAAALARSPEPDLAVVGPASAAALYGLQVLEDGVEDQPGARTRFLLLRRTPTLSSVREQIDHLDDAMLDLLGRRMALAEQAGEAKAPGGGVIRLKADREHAIIQRLRVKAPELGPLIEAVWREIVAGGLARQQALTVAVASANPDVQAWARDRFGAAPTQRPGVPPLKALEEAAAGATIAVLDLRGDVDWLRDFADGRPELWVFDLHHSQDGQAVAAAVGRVDPASLAAGPVVAVASGAAGLILRPNETQSDRARGDIGRVPSPT